MNVRELHAELTALIEKGHGELLVLVSEDPEGNSFMETHQVTGPIVYEGTYYFEPVYGDEEYPLKEIPESDGSIPYVRAVTIWP